MKQPSTLNSLGSVLASQAASQTKNAASGSASAQPFGDLLSREMENRHTASRADTPAADMSANARSSAGQPRQASGQEANREAAGVRNRQEAQRSQERRDAENRQEERTAANAAAGAADSAVAANADTGSNSTVKSAGNSSGTTTAATADKSSKADDDQSAASDDATLADQAGAPVSSAAAALQALVASMAPKAATPLAGTADVAIDAKTAGARGPATVAGGTANAAADEALPHDPAFDALLAQATQLSQARDGGKQAVIGRAQAAGADLQNGAAVTGGAALENFAAMLPAGASAAKAEASLNASALPAALLRDTEAVAVQPGTSAALGTGILQATGAAAAAGTDTLSPRVGTPAWDHALGQKVVWMAAGAEQSASLTLNPPDLGPVQVVINVSNSQADASFTAAQPEVRQALEAALPKLREMLADAGISLGQTSVGAGSPNQQGTADRQQAAGTARRNGSGTPATEEAIAGVSQPTGQRATSSGNGLVNTFA